MMTRRPRGSGCPGFTLIEVMVGIVLISILIMGLMSLHATVGEEFYELNLRQKALLVANGEMERVNALYNYADFRRELEDVNHRDNAATAVTGRRIYRGTPDSILCPVADSSCFLATETADNNVTKAAFPDGQILFMDYQSAAGDNDPSETNVVWIDRDRNVTGRLFWTLEQGNLNDATGANCVDCRFLTLTLQWPFRFVENTSPAQDTMGYFANRLAQNIVLRTIVGDSLNAGLVAYFPFEINVEGDNQAGDEAADSTLSADADTGNANFSTPDDRGGRAASRAAVFNGATYFLDVPDQNNFNDNLDFAAGESFTISAWIRAGDTVPMAIIAKDTDNAGNPDGPGWWLEVNSGAVGRVTFSVGDSTPFVSQVTSDCCGAGIVSTDGTAWNHVVAVRDSAQGLLYLYVDMASTNAADATGALENANSANIGRRIASNADFFNGSIDDVRIYNRALTASEVRALFNLRR